MVSLGPVRGRYESEWVTGWRKAEGDRIGWFPDREDYKDVRESYPEFDQIIRENRNVIEEFYGVSAEVFVRTLLVDSNPKNVTQAIERATKLSRKSRRRR